MRFFVAAHLGTNLDQGIRSAYFKQDYEREKMIKKLTQLKKISVVPAIFYLTFPQTLDAYLDPGTGSIILQVVMGFAAGGLFAVALFWQRTRTFFKNIFSRGKKHYRDED